MGRDRTRIERLEQLNNSSTVSDVTGTAPVVVTTPTVGVRNIAVTGLSGTNTGDQTITLTGDVTGSGTGSFAATLAATAVTAGTYGDSTHYPTLTVDAKGRLTAASQTAIAFQSLTTTGTSGAATLSGGVLNIPQYSGGVDYLQATLSGGAM